MNKWTKPLLIGLGITVIYYGLALVIKGSSRPSTYHGHYEIRLQRKENAATDGEKVTGKIMEILKSRISSTHSKPEIKAINDQTLDLLISNIKDTDQITRLITSDASLQFREMYTLPEVYSGYSKIMHQLGFGNDSAATPPEKPVDTAANSSGLAKFSETEPDPSEIPQPVGEPLITFSQPYQLENSVRYQPQIGIVAIKDSAPLNKILQSPEFLSAAPRDVMPIYGPINERPGIKDDKHLYLFNIRAVPGKPAVLDNDDITSARMDYSQNGVPEVNFVFTPYAAKKWERMTGDNVGKPIAIIFENQVISAPNVLGPIAGGAVSLSGGFTVKEAMDIAVLLNSSALPAKTSIIKQEITGEKGPVIQGNPLVYLLIFAIGTVISYFIINLLFDNPGRAD